MSNNSIRYSKDNLNIDNDNELLKNINIDLLLELINKLEIEGYSREDINLFLYSKKIRLKETKNSECISINVILQEVYKIEEVTDENIKQNINDYYTSEIQSKIDLLTDKFTSFDNKFIKIKRFDSDTYFFIKKEGSNKNLITFPTHKYYKIKDKLNTECRIEFPNINQDFGVSEEKAEIYKDSENEINFYIKNGESYQLLLSHYIESKYIKLYYDLPKKYKIEITLIIKNNLDRKENIKIHKIDITFDENITRDEAEIKTLLRNLSNINIYIQKGQKIYSIIHELKVNLKKDELIDYKNFILKKKFDCLSKKDKHRGFLIKLKELDKKVKCETDIIDKNFKKQNAEYIIIKNQNIDRRFYLLHDKSKKNHIVINKKYNILDKNIEIIFDKPIKEEASKRKDIYIKIKNNRKKLNGTTDKQYILEHLFRIYTSHNYIKFKYNKDKIIYLKLNNEINNCDIKKFNNDVKFQDDIFIKMDNKYYKFTEKTKPKYTDCVEYISKCEASEIDSDDFEFKRKKIPKKTVINNKQYGPYSILLNDKNFERKFLQEKDRNKYYELKKIIFDKCISPYIKFKKQDNIFDIIPNEKSYMLNDKMFIFSIIINYNDIEINTKLNNKKSNNIDFLLLNLEESLQKTINEYQINIDRDNIEFYYTKTPISYLIYKNLLENNNSFGANKHDIKYGLENIYPDINYVIYGNLKNLSKKHNKLYFRGYELTLTKYSSPNISKELQKIFMNKEVFDDFYESFIKRFTENITKNGKYNIKNIKEYEFIYKILYLLSNNSDLDNYYKIKIDEILNLYKSQFKDPITYNYNTLLNVSKIKNDIIKQYSTNIK